MSSTSASTIGTVSEPAIGTAMPSATVVPPTAACSLRTALAIEGYRSASTPTISTSGRRARAATAIPEMSPPPPTGITSMSTCGASSSSSRATVPAPAMIAASSYGRDEHQSFVVLERVRLRRRLLEVLAFENDLRAEHRGAVHLDLRRPHRHHDRRRDVQQGRLVGERLRVVARRHGDDAACSAPQPTGSAACCGRRGP